MRYAGLLCLAGTAFCASAEIYQWRDAAGQVHFSDVAPEAGARKVTPLVTSVYEAPKSSSRPAYDYEREYAREQRKLNRMRENMQREEQARVDADKERRCRQARADSRKSYSRSTSSSTNLAKLRQVRERMNAVNDRIKRYCY